MGKGIVGVVAIYLVAAALLYWPTIFLVFGIDAIGNAAGWWIGDPNSNDGEETFATAIGVVGWVIVLVPAALGARAVAKRTGVRVPVARIGTAALLVAGAIAVFLLLR